MKSIVVDVDGTVCDAINRDYENALPLQPVIDKINILYEQGYKIILYTSRGMNSCHGDISLILEKNEKVLEEWLRKHGVLYHELIFGKPLGDWYVDDKALTVSDFVDMPFYELKGGSGESIRREGNRVIKQGKSSKMQNDWYKVAKRSVYAKNHIPEIYGFTVDTLYMQYIESVNANTDPKRFWDIIRFVESIIGIPEKTNFNLSKYCSNILSHVDEEWTRDLCGAILRKEEDFRKHVSFCHGDPTLANCLISTDSFYVIDPVYKDDFNSYLVDFSKLRMSLNGFEENLNLHTDKLREEYKAALSQFDEYLSGVGILPEVKLLEIANWVRLYNFRKGEEREYAYNKAKTLWKEYAEK